MKLGFLRKLPKGKLQKMVLIGIVTLCAVVGVMQFYVIVNWKKLRDSKGRISALNDQVQQAEKTARRAALDEAHREQVRSFVETQQAAMIAGDPFAWVVREVSLLAEKHLVHVDGLHAGNKLESTGKSNYQPYITRIDLTGAYDQIGLFLRDLESRFPTGEIRSLSVSGGAEDKGRHEAVVELVLRIQPEAKPAKNAEAKKTS
jgi:Tfp pilus assembly protein PilO